MLILGFLGTLVAMGLVLPLVPALSVGRLLRAAAQPASSRHPMVKAMLGKFTACYRLQQPVNNVDSFVDKYVYNYNIGGFFLSTWERISGQPARLLFLLCEIWLIAGNPQIGGQVVELSTIWMGLGISCLLITYHSLLQLPEKRRLVSRLLQDYLGNVLQGKLEKEFLVPAETYSERERGLLQEWELQIPRAVRRETVRDVEERRAEEPERELAASREPESISEKEYTVIEEIVKEYLF